MKIELAFIATVLVVFSAAKLLTPAARSGVILITVRRRSEQVKPDRSKAFLLEKIETDLCSTVRKNEMRVMSQVALLAGLWMLTTASASLAQNAGMTFFVTSVGTGTGANLGGLAGADQHCLKLAEAAGAGSKTWRAYLSTQAEGSATATNARDRIGKGPWQNAKGAVIAKNVDELHGTNNLNKETALNERGEIINGRGDQPNMHDMLTGTQPDGTAFPVGEDRTCGNWTKAGTEGAAMLGHHDRKGLNDTPQAHSWNSSHLTRGGCSQEALKSTGGAGLFYCFAAD